MNNSKAIDYEKIYFRPLDKVIYDNDRHRAIRSVCRSLQSCDDDDEIQNKPTLYIITEDIEALSTYGGTIPIEFLCNLDWQVSTDAAWITLDAKAGSQSATINAKVTKNDEGVDRMGVIKIVAGELEKD